MSKSTSALIKHTMEASAPCVSQFCSSAHGFLKRPHSKSKPEPELTPASWLSLIPLWVLRIRALDHHRALLQRVSRVTGEFHHRPDAVGGVAAAEVAVLHKGFVTHAFGKSFGHNTQKGFTLGSLRRGCWSAAVFTPAFVSDGSTGRGYRPVCGELYEQVTSSAEHTFVGQILHLIGVVDRGGIYVVAVLDQQSKNIHRDIDHISCRVD